MKKLKLPPKPEYDGMLSTNLSCVEVCMRVLHCVRQMLLHELMLFSYFDWSRILPLEALFVVQQTLFLSKPLRDPSLLSVFISFYRFIIKSGFDGLSFYYWLVVPFTRMPNCLVMLWTLPNIRIVFWFVVFFPLFLAIKSFGVHTKTIQMHHTLTLWFTNTFSNA